MLEAVLQEEERSDENSQEMSDVFDSPVNFFAWEKKNKQKYLVRKLFSFF